MSDWREVTLGEVADLTVGFVGTMARHYQDVGVPFLRSQNVLPHRIELGDTKFISAEFNARIAKSQLRPGDVVTVRTGAPGTTAVIPDTLQLANCADLVITRPGTELDAFWLSYYMNSTASHSIASALVGAVQQHFNVGSAKKMRLSLPPLVEQQAIAEVLGAIDDKIAANTRLSVAARQLAVAMISSAGPATKLSNVVRVHKGQVNPSTMAGGVVEHYSLPAFDVGAGPDVVDPGVIKSRKFVVSTPVVLMSKLNPQTPRIWPVNGEQSKTRLASTEFLVLEPTASSPWVLWALLSQTSFGEVLKSMVAGTSGSHQRVRPYDVLATPIRDPRCIGPDMMRDVDAVLAPVDGLLNENRTLAATRDALLPQLMSGKMRVRDAQAAASEAGV